MIDCIVSGAVHTIDGWMVGGIVSNIVFIWCVYTIN